jgi:hypothetical protein
MLIQPKMYRAELMELATPEVSVSSLKWAEQAGQVEFNVL